MNRQSPQEEDSIVQRENTVTELGPSRVQSRLSGPMIPHFSAAVGNIRVSPECDVSHHL